MALLMILWLAGSGWRQTEFDQLAKPNHLTKPRGARVPVNARSGFLCDINFATWPELAQLPGIGQTLAERIVERRAKFGPYTSLNELLEIRGIGQKKLAAILPYLDLKQRRQ